MNSNVDNDTFSIDANGNMTITVKNEINLCNLRLIKTNDDSKKLEGAEFTLYSDKDCTKVIDKAITNSDGKINFDRIVVGDYYLKETKAPDGYRLLEDTIKVSLKPIDGTFKFLINDKEIQNDGNYTLAIENNLYTGTMTIVNERGNLLPATGSGTMIILVAAGCTFMATAIVLSKKRKSKK